MFIPEKFVWKNRRLSKTSRGWRAFAHKDTAYMWEILDGLNATIYISNGSIAEGMEEGYGERSIKRKLLLTGVADGGFSVIVSTLLETYGRSRQGRRLDVGSEKLGQFPQHQLKTSFAIPPELQTCGTRSLIL